MPGSIYCGKKLISPLYVNGIKLGSEEGTTQGNPIARGMYGLAILPLIQKISKVNVIHKWFVDDGNACGRISDLYETFRALKTEGPEYGYFVNAPKCQVIVKIKKIGPRPGELCGIKRAYNSRNQSTRFSHRHSRNMREIL